MAIFKRTSRLQPAVKRRAKYTADKVGGMGLRSGAGGRRSGEQVNSGAVEQEKNSIRTVGSTSKLNKKLFCRLAKKCE
jgi:hypothetical protein